MRKAIDSRIELSYGQVILTDPYLLNAFEMEISYLLSLDHVRLLRKFYDQGNLNSDKEPYPGWEVTEIAGHTLGHYLTAISQVYGYNRDSRMKERLDECIRELALCQREDGYLFASQEEIFDRVEQRKPAWVPWYTMHKLMEGLLSAYRLGESNQALIVAKQLGFWIYNRVSKWSESLKNTVLSVEYGGMNDCLYELYEYTNIEEFLKAAEQFDEICLFQKLYVQQDVLNGLHANTTIPKILGALNRYRNTNEDWYLVVAENFWDMVVNHHTYITGGNSEWEHFGRPDILDQERTACNCETCNTYNMLKLSKGLYQMTKKTKYMDFYEHTFTNAIVSSQHPKTGMTMYFQPMAAGYFKTFSDPYDKFWCCTGTGMENFTKLCESICFIEEDTLFVERLLSCEITHKGDEKHTKIELVYDPLNEENQMIKIHAVEKESTKIRIRIPKWAHGGVNVTRGNTRYQIKPSESYMLFEQLKEGEVIFITIPLAVEVHRLPDQPATVAFTYGPVVLCGLLGSDMMNTTVTGVDVTVPKKEFFIKDYLVIEKDANEWITQNNECLRKIPGEVAFYLHGTDEDKKIKFVPYYSQYQQRYAIYFRIYQKGSGELLHSQSLKEREHSIEKEAIDIIPVGNDQYELAHWVKGECTDFCIKNGHGCRFIEDGGYLSYRLKREGNKDTLCITYQLDELDALPEVEINQVIVEEKEGRNTTEDGYGTFLYTIPEPQELGDNTVTVVFRNRGILQTCRIYDYVYIRKGEV